MDKHIMGNYINVPLTKTGPVRVQMRTDTHVLDIEITEEEAKELSLQLFTAWSYRQDTGPRVLPPFPFCNE